MPHKKRDKRTILERWKFKYKLFILNENTLEEVFRIKISRFTVFLYSSLALIIVFFLMSVLILYSPLKYYLPGFSDYSLRTDLFNNIAKIDSIETYINRQQLQLQTAKNIINGTLSIDSIPQQKEISVEKYKELAEKKSKAEEKFVDNFQKNITKPPFALIAANADRQSMAKPLSGIIAIIDQNPPENPNALILSSKTDKVLAISDGVIISIELTIKNRYIMVIQHQEGYVSIYKNISSPLKKRGDKVHTSEVIGAIDLKSQKPYLIFEIWQNNVSIYPKEVLSF